MCNMPNVFEEKQSISFDPAREQSIQQWDKERKKVEHTRPIYSTVSGIAFICAVMYRYQKKMISQHVIISQYILTAYRGPRWWSKQAPSFPSLYARFIFIFILFQPETKPSSFWNSQNVLTIFRWIWRLFDAEIVSRSIY